MGFNKDLDAKHKEILNDIKKIWRMFLPTAIY